jgi:hypothetical protein
MLLLDDTTIHFPLPSLSCTQNFFFGGTEDTLLTLLSDIIFPLGLCFEEFSAAARAADHFLQSLL